MIAQIQTYFSHLFGKLVALALFLFILTSFNLQMITATAQTTPPAKPTNNSDTTTGKNILKQNEVDNRIGTLKNCTVNAENETGLKNDPTKANDFILNCLKDIIKIVITISVILAIMRLIFVGIKFLNTFEDEGKLQSELAKAITGFVAGAVILGLFAAIINVVNPSALRIDKIFSAQVIADYKCLNKGISDPVAAKVSTSTCKDNPQGSGPSTSNEVYTSESIQALFSKDKPTPEEAKKQNEVKVEIDKCNSNSNLTFGSATEASKCALFQEFSAKNPSVGSVGLIDSALELNMSTDRFANGTYSNITVNSKTITADYIRNGSTKVKKIVFYYIEGCENSPLLKEKTIISGQRINFAGCNMDISSNK